MEKANLACFSLAVRESNFVYRMLWIGIRHAVDSQNANNLRICQNRCELCSNSYREKNWRVTYSRLYLRYQISIPTDREPRSRSIVLHMMVTQRQSLPSFSSFLSVLSILFYCAGFLRVELELNEQKKRINALENNAKTEPRPSNERSVVEITRTRSSRKFFFGWDFFIV